jgi:malate dehydrogenase (oxaloacetate-decarboxylating)(NADP+)
MNYARLCERDMAELKIVVNGAGAAGIRITEMLKTAGVKSVTICDSRGVIRSDRSDLNPQKREHAVDSTATTVGEALQGAHVFVGVSVADCIKPSDIEGMASYPAIFAMANPNPEIKPELVAEFMGDRPYVMATGRSDYPNQINNVLGFPFLFKGALEVGATTINKAMKVAASEALARVAREPITEEVQAYYPAEHLTLGANYIIPKPFDRRLFVEVSTAVAEAAIASGVAANPPQGSVRDMFTALNESRG